MKRLFLNLLTVVVVLIAVVGLAGCSSGGGDNSDGYVLPPKEYAQWRFLLVPTKVEDIRLNAVIEGRQLYHCYTENFVTRELGADAYNRVEGARPFDIIAFSTRDPANERQWTVDFPKIGLGGNGQGGISMRILSYDKLDDRMSTKKLGASNVSFLNPMGEYWLVLRLGDGGSNGLVLYHEKQASGE